MNSEDYRAWRWQTRAANKERIARNRKYGLEQIKALSHEGKVGVDIKNDGAHLIAKIPSLVVDYWPGTGKWIARNHEKTSGRGIGSLRSFIKREYING